MRDEVQGDANGAGFADLLELEEARPGDEVPIADGSSRATHRSIGVSPAAMTVTEDALARRLRMHGLQPRQGRNTALFMLAAEIPAAILGKTLGLHIKAAIQWQQISSGYWTPYAAEVSQ